MKNNNNKITIEPIKTPRQMILELHNRYQLFKEKLKFNSGLFYGFWGGIIFLFLLNLTTFYFLGLDDRQYFQAIGIAFTIAMLLLTIVMFIILLISEEKLKQFKNNFDYVQKTIISEYNEIID